jgi:ribosomal protein L14
MQHEPVVKPDGSVVSFQQWINELVEEQREYVLRTLPGTYAREMAESQLRRMEQAERR